MSSAFSKSEAAVIAMTDQRDVDDFQLLLVVRLDDQGRGTYLNVFADGGHFVDNIPISRYEEAHYWTVIL